MSHLYKIFISRLKALNSIVKYIFIICFISIVFTELYFIKIESFNELQYSIGIIYIKLCYSYFSAFIFYYLIVFNPKENRKVISFMHITNKIRFLAILLNKIFVIVLKNDIEFTNEVTRENLDIQIDLYIKSKWPKEDANRGRTFQNISFNQENNYLLNSIIDKSIQIIDEILLINDLIDSKTLYFLLRIKNDLQLIKDMKFFHIPDYNSMMSEINISLLELSEIKDLRKQLIDNYKNKMENIYGYESRIQYHKNKKDIFNSNIIKSDSPDNVDL